MTLHFVVQEHQARTHHFDLRLERAGVYKSWAVPKGLPDTPGVNRLAIQVEDHDLSFGNFEGLIPEGNRGAGSIAVWDHGTYRVEEWTKNRIMINIEGTKLLGPYRLIRMRGKEGRQWLIAKVS